jgi:hypothetical protein
MELTPQAKKHIDAKAAEEQKRFFWRFQRVMLFVCLLMILACSVLSFAATLDSRDQVERFAILSISGSALLLLLVVGFLFLPRPTFDQHVGRHWRFLFVVAPFLLFALMVCYASYLYWFDADWRMDPTLKTHVAFGLAGIVLSFANFLTLRGRAK